MAIHTGDENIAIIVTVKENGTPLVIPPDAHIYANILLPNGQLLPRLARLNTDGSDGAVEVQCNELNFPLPGTYQVEVVLAFDGGRYTSDAVSFPVTASLENIARRAMRAA